MSEPEITPNDPDAAAHAATGAPDAPDPAPVTDASIIAQLEAERADLKEQLLRAIAETGNVRIRADRDLAAAREFAVDRFARDLLGVADNLERALKVAQEAAGETDRQLWPDSLRTLFEGVELTERALMHAFDRHQLKKLTPLGEVFDPNLHQAVAQIPSALPAGQVAELFQAGYLLSGRVLRAAMVAVSAGPITDASPAGAAAMDEHLAPPAEPGSGS